MSLRVLAFSDLHLNDREDINLYPLEEEVRSRSEEKQVDVFVTLGDVIDNIPRDREKNGELVEEDIATGRYFLEQLGEISQRNDIQSYAIPGNHDYDIFGDMIQTANGHQIRGVNDGRGANIVSSGDETYGFVGKDVEDFDIGPEVDPETYGIKDLDELVEEMYQVATADRSIEDAADNLDILVEDYKQFHSDCQELVDSFEDLADSFQEVYGQADSEDTVLMSHIAPFNTNLDAKEIGRDYSSHQGSITNRVAIEHFTPGLGLNGHHDYHNIDQISRAGDYGSESYVVGIDERRPTEIVLDQGTVSVEQR